MFKFRKIAVGISGGVDSAVAALLLKQKGFEVQGVFMQNWDITDERGVCSADEDYKDAALVCNKLNIKLHYVNFVKEYWNEVFCYLVKEYESGCTPNPDVLCNKRIKFNYFNKYALETLKVDAIATGHYACTSFGPFLEDYSPNENVKLLKAKDRKKDQAFFLCQIPQNALRRTMFPLSHYLKSEVKDLAAKYGFEKILKKPESMGICFIGSRNFQDFIREYIPDNPGNFIDVDNAEIVGQHLGYHLWTLGQRSRIPDQILPYFIARKNVENNIIYVASGTDHSILYSFFVFTSKPYWIHSQPAELKNGHVFDCEFKFQHTESWLKCQMMETSSGLTILLEKDQRAISPGQFAVFKKGDEYLGSARILNHGLSNFALNYFDEVNRKEKQTDLDRLSSNKSIKVKQTG